MPLILRKERRKKIVRNDKNMTFIATTKATTVRNVSCETT